jgi:hypothetical protein
MLLEIKASLPMKMCASQFIFSDAPMGKESQLERELKNKKGKKQSNMIYDGRSS